MILTVNQLLCLVLKNLDQITTKNKQVLAHKELLLVPNKIQSKTVILKAMFLVAMIWISLEKLKAHTIEKLAKINAYVFAKIVNGNIEASEKIVIIDSGNVTGGMSTPKVILKDGSYFKGNVSMTDTKVKTPRQSTLTKM